MSKNIKIALIIILILIIGSAVYYSKNFDTAKSTACTEEAKICPDGSSVGRTGANCEFAACPINKNSFEKILPLIGMTKEQLIAELKEQPKSTSEGGLEFLNAGIRVWFAPEDFKLVGQIFTQSTELDFNGVKIGSSMDSFKNIFGKPKIEDTESSFVNFEYKGLTLNVLYNANTKEVFAVYILKEWAR